MVEVETSYMESLPTEILIYLFRFLKPKDRAKCCQVCWRWKRIIDNFTTNDVLWLEHCKNDFQDTFSSAYYKRTVGIKWYNIYRSLFLWSRLDEAVETIDEFASAPLCMDEIRDFLILRFGVIGVHTRGAINYYDFETLKPSFRISIPGTYLRYAENDDNIAILGFNLNLLVARKLLLTEHHKTDTSFANVKSYLLSGDDLVYITLKDEIFLCNLQEDNLESVLIGKAPCGIMALGYDKGKINLLTLQRDIFSIVNKKLVHICQLESSMNLLHEMKKYNFLEHVDWRVYFQWMYVLKQTVPQGPLRDVIIVKPYGDVMLVGSSWGVFRIYYAPYTNGELDIFNKEPIKQYNFMERDDCPVLSMCPIIQIDVIEGRDSHTILVAMPKKIAVITYKHSFKDLTAAVTHTEASNVKIVESSECPSAPI